jgi:hypothetical protein
MLMYDASSRKDIRRAEKAASRAEADRVEFIRAALSTFQGRAWFHDLLAFCHIFADPFSGDALREAYSKGERNIGLYIYNDVVTHCPDQFIRMMREAHEKELAYEQSGRNDPGDGGDDLDDDSPANQLP